MPDGTGIYLVHLRQFSGETLEYPVSVCAPKSIKIVRGFNLDTADFSPAFSKGEEAVVVLFIGEAGPGKLEAELTHPSGTDSPNRVFSKRLFTLKNGEKE
jgi:hypothetical protein